MKCWKRGLPAPGGSPMPKWWTDTLNAGFFPPSLRDYGIEPMQFSVDDYYCALEALTIAKYFPEAGAL